MSRAVCWFLGHRYAWVNPKRVGNQTDWWFRCQRCKRIATIAKETS